MIKVLIEKVRLVCCQTPLGNESDEMQGLIYTIYARRRTSYGNQDGERKTWEAWERSQLKSKQKT